MDNLKKNLHFVVFGVGVLLGIILLGVGIMWRGGTEEALASAQADLAAKTKVASRGTLDEATARSERFGSSLQEADARLRNTGGAFESSYDSHQSGGEFYSAEARPALQRLKNRFAAMNRNNPMPALLDGWEVTRTGAERVQDQAWEQLEREMLSPSNDKIREMQMRLRVLEELATTCEKLIETGIGGDFGVKLTEFRFEAYGVAAIGAYTNETDSPWYAMPVSLKLECSPSFAVALVDELVNPTSRTMTPTADKNQRKGFPILLDMMQTEMVERPPVVRYDINNDDKEAAARKLNDKGAGITLPNDPKKLDPAEGEGKKLVEAADKDLNQEDRVALPVRVGLKLRAATFNKNWRAVKKDEGNQ